MHIPDSIKLFGNRELLLAARAALAGGEIIATSYGKLWEVTEKGVGDLVSKIDKEAEEAILARIQKEDPASNVLSEESVHAQDTASTSQWIIDPLDGTSAFLFRVGKDKPSVLIAHQQDEVTNTAVIFIPLTEEWFYAVRGKGAFKGNGERLSVQKTIPLKEAWVEMNHFGDAAFESTVFAKLRTKLRSKEGGRLVTSQAPHSAVAMRILDGTTGLAAVIHDNHSENIKQAVWDVAAPQLIVEEAGGVVLNMQGERYDMSKAEPFIIAGSRELADEIIYLAKT